MLKSVNAIFLRKETLAMKIHKTGHYMHNITNERYHCHYVAYIY